MESSLEQLKKWTAIAADSADIHSLPEGEMQDLTTNPSLIYQIIHNPLYEPLVQEAFSLAKSLVKEQKRPLASACQDAFSFCLAKKILQKIKGRVSIELDARLSFDTEGTLLHAKRLLDLFHREAIPTDRILIKIAATWEGIEAARSLEKEGVFCNLTLVFSLTQAAACAEASVTLISPFVGRVLDWYQEKEKRVFSIEEDPGVLSLRKIYAYYKHFAYSTEIMGASFRSLEQVLSLAGIDLMTLSPSLLKELSSSSQSVARSIDQKINEIDLPIEKLRLDGKSFRFALNEDAMASEKLSEGIRNFCRDTRHLESHFLSL